MKLIISREDIDEILNTGHERNCVIKLNAVLVKDARTSLTEVLQQNTVQELVATLANAPPDGNLFRNPKDLTPEVIRATGEW